MAVYVSGVIIWIICSLLFYWLNEGITLINILKTIFWSVFSWLTILVMTFYILLTSIIEVINYVVRYIDKYGDICIIPCPIHEHPHRYYYVGDPKYSTEIIEALKDDGAKSDMPRDCGMHSDVIYYVDEHGYVWNYPYLDMDRLHLPSYYVKGNYKLKHRL